MTSVSMRTQQRLDRGRSSIARQPSATWCAVQFLDALDALAATFVRTRVTSEAPRWFRTPAKDFLGGAFLALPGLVVRFSARNPNWVHARPSRPRRSTLGQEHHAIFRLFPINLIEMYVEILAPKIRFSVLVVKDANAERMKNRPTPQLYPVFWRYCSKLFPRSWMTNLDTPICMLKCVAGRIWARRSNRREGRTNAWRADTSPPRAG